MPEAYNKICDKVSNLKKNGFTSEPVYNKKYLNIKIKSYDGKIKKDFQDNGVPKEGYHFFLSVILILGFCFKDEQKL